MYYVWRTQISHDQYSGLERDITQQVTTFRIITLQNTHIQTCWVNYQLFVARGFFTDIQYTAMLQQQLERIYKKPLYMSRILPHRPLSHQADDYPAHLSPSSSAPPVLHRLLDYLLYICHSPWFFPQVLLTLFFTPVRCLWLVVIVWVIS